MIEHFKKAIRWIKSIVSESDGQGSSSRIAVVVIVATVCFCCIWHTVVNKTMPDGGSLGGFSGMIGSGGALYGLNAWKKIRQTQAGSDDNAPTT